jgi:general secretion pathway protein H
MAGYTLVEMLTVLAIMGFLAAVAIPLLSTSHPGLDARATANALAQDLRATRQAAIDSGGEARLVLKARRYIRLPGGKLRTLPPGVAIAFTGPARDEIDFYPDGSTSGGTVTVFAAHARHRVTVRWPSGEIALDD